jgi:hypothetical protein
MSVKQPSLGCVSHDRLTALKLGAAGVPDDVAVQKSEGRLKPILVLETHMKGQLITMRENMQVIVIVIVGKRQFDLCLRGAWPTFVSPSKKSIRM